MSAFIDLTDQQFGRLTVVRLATIKTTLATQWDVVCSCGGETTVSSNNLRRGDVVSCGCYSAERLSTLHVWTGMVNRECDMPVEWIDSFEQFVADLGYKPSKEHFLWRGDNTKAYSKSNCFWNKAKPVVSASIRHSFKALEYKGEVNSLRVWCRELNLPYDAIRERLLNGMPIQKAFTDPIRKRNANLEIEYAGSVVSLPKLCSLLGVPYTTAIRRIRLGTTVEQLIAQAA